MKKLSLPVVLILTIFQTAQAQKKIVYDFGKNDLMSTGDGVEIKITTSFFTDKAFSNGAYNGE